MVSGKDHEGLKGEGLIGLAPVAHVSKKKIPGFIQQLKSNPDFTNNFEQMFSIYLSSNSATPGGITFGGYDIQKYAKSGQEINWIAQSDLSAYWAVNSKSV